MQKIKFEDFPTGNESGRFLVNPFWLEYLLNLFYQGYIVEVWEEIQETSLNSTKTIVNVSYGVIRAEFSKKHLDEDFIKKVEYAQSSPKTTGVKE